VVPNREYLLWPSVYRKKLKNLILDRPLVTLKSTDTVSVALKTLADNGISGAPVILEQKGEQGSGSEAAEEEDIIGFVDVLDLLAFMGRVVSPDAKKLAHWDASIIEQIKKHGDEFKTHQVADLINLSKRNPFIVLDGEHTLRDAVDFFVEQDGRRVGVRIGRKIVGIVTKWAIASYLATNIQSTEDIPMLNQPVGVTDFKTDQVRVVDYEVPAIVAFMRMYDCYVSSLAVTDEKRRFVTNISASDLKSLQEKDFDLLLKPVREYFDDIATFRGRPSDYKVTCNQNTALIDVITQMMLHKVHRVYIVDGYDAVCGVVSLTDVMRAIGRQFLAKMKEGEQAT